jgi:DNA-directed RNA polymerase sigma subunit (sigma70/sigma32)
MRPSEQARLDAGLCIKGCGRPHKPKAQRCEHCTKRAASVIWQSRLTAERKPRGPARRIRPVNLGTDGLIEAHMGLAKGLAIKTAARYGLSDASDLVGDALYGLVVAGRTFDHSYGVPFGAWATTQIRGAVMQGLQQQWRLTKGEEPFIES